MNPCIDCHAKMISRAGELMASLGFDFVATGEVMNQRPMSQNRQSLGVVEKCSGLKGRLVRPLSAQLLEPTIPEQEGRLDRSRLLGLSGRQRLAQMELAEKFGVIEQTYYCSPSWRKVVEWRKVAPKGRSMVWLGNFPRDNSPESVAKTEAFVQKRLDEMAATGFDGSDQVQIHVRTDLSKEDPFCPSTPFIKKAIETMHGYGVTVNGVTWTEGTNAEVHRRMWEIGFDHFTSDYPEFFSEFAKTIRK